MTVLLPVLVLLVGAPAAAGLDVDTQFLMSLTKKFLMSLD
jgi:hypothetical protein